MASLTMVDHHIYLNETGTLDFEDRPGEAYFGIGSAYYRGDHRDSLWRGHQLRLELEAKSLQLPKGLHAKNDSHGTRTEVYDEIASQPVRFDATMLLKHKAYPNVQAAGKVRLYKLAVWMHLKYVIPARASTGDRVFVVVGQLQTDGHRSAIRNAVHDICLQLPDYTVIPCIWEAPSAWGIQVADYGLWRIQRMIEGKSVPGYTEAIKGQIESVFRPWG